MSGGTIEQRGSSCAERSVRPTSGRRSITTELRPSDRRVSAGRLAGSVRAPAWSRRTVADGRRTEDHVPRRVPGERAASKPPCRRAAAGRCSMASTASARGVNCGPGDQGHHDHRDEGGRHRTDRRLAEQRVGERAAGMPRKATDVTSDPGPARRRRSARTRRRPWSARATRCRAPAAGRRSTPPPRTPSRRPGRCPGWWSAGPAPAAPARRPPRPPGSPGPGRAARRWTAPRRPPPPARTRSPGTRRSPRRRPARPAACRARRRPSRRGSAAAASRRCRGCGVASSSCIGHAGERREQVEQPEQREHPHGGRRAADAPSMLV